MFGRYTTGPVLPNKRARVYHVARVVSIFNRPNHDTKPGRWESALWGRGHTPSRLRLPSYTTNARRLRKDSHSHGTVGTQSAFANKRHVMHALCQNTSSMEHHRDS